MGCQTTKHRYEATHDSYFIAAQIAEIAKQGAYDLIFTGKETIDYNGSSIGGKIGRAHV